MTVSGGYSFLHPRTLLTWDRLDLAIKHDAFRHLLKGDDPASLDLYRWHIAERTGGIEPRSWKRSVEDYVQACRDLLISMQHGFDISHAVPIGSNGKIIDGAHRIACALLLDLNIWIERRPELGRAQSWGRLDLRYLPETELDRIEASMAKLMADR